METAPLYPSFDRDDPKDAIRPSAAQSFLLNGLLLLASCLVAFGAAEILVRVVKPQQLILLRPDIWQPVDSLGWNHRADVITRINTGERTVTYVTDSEGYRIDAKGRAAGQIRVLLLGDSFMEALQVDYEKSLAGLIERCSRVQLGQTIGIWNAGVGGWDPPQYFVQAGRSLNQHPFDLIVVAVSLANDVVPQRKLLPPRRPAERRSFRLPRKLAWDEFIDATLGPFNDAMETRSHLFILLKHEFARVLMRAGLTALEIPTELRRDQAKAPRWELTGKIFADIDSLGRSSNIPTLFVLIPSIEQLEPAALTLRTEAFGVNPDDLDLEQPNRLLSAELDRRGLDYISVLPDFRNAKADGQSLYGRVDPHLSPIGHQVLWNAIAPRIAAVLHLPYLAGTAETEPECVGP